MGSIHTIRFLRFMLIGAAVLSIGLSITFIATGSFSFHKIEAKARLLVRSLAAKVGVEQVSLHPLTERTTGSQKPSSLPFHALKEIFSYTPILESSADPLQGLDQLLLKVKSMILKSETEPFAQSLFHSPGTSPEELMQLAQLSTNASEGCLVPKKVGSQTRVAQNGDPHRFEPDVATVPILNEGCLLSNLIGL